MLLIVANIPFLYALAYVSRVSASVMLRSTCREPSIIDLIISLHIEFINYI